MCCACVALALGLSSCSSSKGSAPGTGPPPTSRLASVGAALVLVKPCLTCHTTSGARAAGPTFKDLYGSKVRLSDGSTVVADDAYLVRSIRDPNAQTVARYNRTLMATLVPPRSITARQAQAIVAYLKTLSTRS